MTEVKNNTIQKVENNNTVDKKQKEDILSLVFYLLAESANTSLKIAKTNTEKMQANSDEVAKLVRSLGDNNVGIPPELYQKIMQSTSDPQLLSQYSSQLMAVQQKMSVASAQRDYLQSIATSERQQGQLLSTEENTLTEQIAQTTQAAASMSKTGLTFAQTLFR